MSESNKNKLELKQLVQSRASIAAFIGAGCSAVLNIPIWDKLLLELNRQFGPFKESELINAIKTDGHARVASYIEASAKDKNHYKEMLKKHTKPRSCHFTSLHLELLQLTKTVITTNYDMSIEEALECLKRINREGNFDYRTLSIGGLSLYGIGVNRGIYHIHGNNTDGTFVLTFESYREQYENDGSGLADLIRTVFKEFSVVFVGFSFNDDFFVNFLQNTLSKVKGFLEAAQKGPLPPHFCIVSSLLYKDFFYAPELTERKVPITELIQASYLIAKDLGDTKEAVLYIDETKEDEIRRSGFAQEVKTILLNQIEINKGNRKKIELFKELNIKPIVFEGENYLEIETILRELNTMGGKVATSYDPNLNQ
ncbi:hypothetical protein GCM10028786_24600 [Flaviaesturariibacter terrae]